MLDTHRLRVFRSVVASGSVQGAAANLGYTPSAVSQHVTALQRETGLALFERAGRGLRATAAGLVLADQADAILSRLGEAEVVVADLRAGRTGALSLSYFASVGGAWLPRVVRRLGTEFPDVRLDLALREWLPDDPADRSDLQIAVERPDFEAWPGFTAHHLLDDPYVAVLPETHPLADRAEIELAELSGERWVDNDFARGWCRRNLVEACTAAGFRPPFHVEAHDYPTALAFVAAGIGITVLPELGAVRIPAGTCAVPVVRPVPVRSILAVVRDAAAHTPPVLAALDELRAVAAIPVGAPRSR
ncbi:putative LysR-family transcriptional regulator [Pseudonocardia sp. Ae168_Ps1]|uniref:LysR family transcriptional regulator n=1 Tax=unclassified Pseudonocardia TaxID=2619320 RepID=UPI00094AB5B4|nr:MULTISPECIES: LysR family transcriptional regulator [unclassified Pseudonocardia]OLL75002.1 putative LysR-family transcriptional regulator [Pseudonocardia sp. Ae150A_Ps1]OLL80995.1 putative LysR-family transcriptional regulator [Pseudonocardia sp. Ae168_Ps1]OLL84889.1 putative LysR-family transcriptional regulator [Pseudonocardia sp. Ae263_Ps1]OLL95094.1 putative LysR-family transcriptional regulator [Pseudonocardia sp. Ae356_Ps1]